MQLRDYTATKAPTIPDKLMNKITMVANYPLNDNDVKVFNYAFLAIEKQLEIDNIDYESLLSVNILFTKDGSFSMIGDRLTFGYHFSLAVYALESLNRIKNERFKLVAFIEELVHHFWKIEDETQVKYKVVEIAQLIDKNISIELLKEWGVNGL